jgi:four helix bundle protein
MYNQGSFEDLECWKAAYMLKEYVRKKILPLLPAHEKYELHDQLRRSSRSAPANIAEGWGRFHYKDSIQYMFIARGSLAETLNHSIEARDCSYISEDILKEVRILQENAIKLLNGYIRYLTNKNKG